MEFIEESLANHYFPCTSPLMTTFIQASIPSATGSKVIVQKNRRNSAIGRHVTWTPDDIYELLHQGTAVQNETEIFELHQQRRLTPAYFYIFKHKDGRLARNVDIPVYEAVYWCIESQRYVLVQKRHLRAAYAAVSQNKREHMYDIDAATGKPYWVDRHLFCVLKQLETKRVYDAKQVK